MTVRYELDLTGGDDAEIVAARLWAAGALGVQELPTRLVGWFDTRDDDVPPGGTWSQEPARDWLAAWRASIDPVVAGRVHVVPTWLVEEHTTPDGHVRLVLDPGIAFGSGHHATTRMALEAVERAAPAGARVLDVGAGSGILQAALAPGDRVLDVGCGTGILAIAAVLLGAGEVEAVDVDADAVVATRRNAAANEVGLTALLGGVEAASGPADVVLANLLTPVLHDLATELVAAVAGVTDALTAAGGEPVRRRDEDGWSVLVHRVPAVGP